MISVIIPLYNKEAIVEHSVKSVLSQDYDDYEIVIVNDGSTDRSVEIVKSIHDPHITLVEQKNGGPSKARNTGVKHAKGERILFLDADDELLPGALRQCWQYTQKYPDVDIFDFGRQIRNGSNIITRYNNEGGYINNNFKSWYYDKIAPGAGVSLFSRSIVERCPYREDIRRYEDAEILFQMFKTAIIYSASPIIETHNVDYSSASNARENIKDDYVGHLSLKGLDFWGRLCMYRLYLMERDNYIEEMKRLYPLWRYRYDLLIIHKVLNWFR